MSSHRMPTTFGVVLLSAFLAVLPAQSSQTLPNGFLTADGNNSTAYPQNATADHKWQWHYDSGQFTATTPILITEIWIRASLATATVAAFNFPSFTVTLASSPTSYTVAASGTTPGHSATFAANLNPDATVVRTGPWTGGPVGPSGAAAATWIPLGLTGTFTYNPTLGNDFVVQIEKCGTTAVWGTSLDGQSGTAGLTGGNRYGNLTSCSAATQGFSNNEFVPIVRIDYFPAGLAANFTAAPTSGPAALAVSFTDQSFTNDPGGITSWAWDFQNDGTIDSTLQNPAFTYFVPGTYSVRLTVTDASHPASSRLRTDYITVGPYQLVVVTSGGGVGDIVIIPPPPPPGPGEGFLFLSHTPPVTIGTGAFFGLNFDDFVLFCLSQPALPGLIFHFTLPAGGLFPAVPFGLGPGAISVLTGVTLDFVLVTLSGGAIEVSNVARITV